MNYNIIVFINNDLSKGDDILIKLKDLRVNNNLTQEELASKCDVLRTTISMIENGVNKPSVELAKKFGEIFNVDWKGFFE